MKKHRERGQAYFSSPIAPKWGNIGTYHINQGCHVPQGINACKTSRTPRSMTEKSIDAGREGKQNPKR